MLPEALLPTIGRVTVKSGDFPVRNWSIQSVGEIGIFRQFVAIRMISLTHSVADETEELSSIQLGATKRFSFYVQFHLGPVQLA